MSEKTVYIIDDDSTVLSAIETLLDKVGLKSQTFTSAVSFLESYDGQGDGCILLDLKMPKMDGLELQKELIKLGNTWPIIFLSGYGDISVAVEAMKTGAVDFIQKPFGNDALLECVDKAFRVGSRINSSLNTSTFDEKVSLLTPREHEVMELLATSKTNKEIARILEISPRTVEVHRKNVMKKLDIKSAVDLVRLMK